MTVLITLMMTLFSLSSLANSNQEKLLQIKDLNRIAFGSCNNQNDKQPLWKDVTAQNPDLWIWGGDAIYADWGKSDSVKKAYDKQNEIPDYKEMKSKIPIIGTWDDHDYAFNNAGGGVDFKDLSLKMHLDFMDVPTDSPRRNRKGIYTSFDFGDDDKRIKIIVLDNRYFKGLDTKAPILGEEQWNWLDQELKNSKAHLHFLVTGLSVFSPTIPYTEEWWHYPVEVNRMQDLLKKHKVKAPVFLTGDKHFSSIFKYWGQLEFMSSGMTHVAPRKTWWYLARKYPTTYFGLSYGLIDIEWENTVPKLTMSMRTGSRDIHKTKVMWKNNTWVFLSKSSDPSTVMDESAPTDEHVKEGH